MTGSPPRVWFERPVYPELLAEVVGACEMLEPGSAPDTFAGIDAAVAVMAATGRYDGAVMDRAPGLRVIARTGIGYDAVDLDAATQRGIAVCNTPDGPTVSTAEHAAALMLSVAKNIKRSETALQSGRTQGYYIRHGAMELEGKVLGLIGCGRIARHFARIAAGFGMHPIAYDPFLAGTSFPEGVTPMTSLEDLLRAADVVSVHVPLSEATVGLIGADEFAQMKPGAVFINTARGPLVDADALLEALDAGRLAGAGLDVTTPEPLPPGHPLLGRDDIVVTPHVASATSDGRVRIFRSAFAQVFAVLEGRRPEHLVNPEVWDRIAASSPAGGRR